MTQVNSLPYQDAGTLTINGLALTRGERPLFDNLSFSVAPSDTVWVCGANGIGKTSLLKCVAGLIRPDEGTLSWLSAAVPSQNIEAAYKNGICVYQGHNDAHKPNLTATENLEFWADVFGATISATAALHSVGLSPQANQRAHTLSAGQKRRLSLARLMLRDAPLWVLDEPAAPMDETGRSLIRSMLRAHLARRGCVLIASHRTPSQLGPSTRVLTLKEAAPAPENENEHV